MITLWAILLVGVSFASTGATLVLGALWRADVQYRSGLDRHLRGWLASTLFISSVMVLIPCWYFAGSITWRIVNNMATLPTYMTVVSIIMVVLALGSPVYLAYRVLTARTREQEISQHIAAPETQNQREDREFGEQRRELEAEHIEAAEDEPAA